MSKLIPEHSRDLEEPRVLNWGSAQRTARQGSVPCRRGGVGTGSGGGAGEPALCPSEASDPSRGSASWLPLPASPVSGATAGLGDSWQQLRSGAQC